MCRHFCCYLCSASLASLVAFYKGAVRFQIQIQTGVQTTASWFWPPDQLSSLTAHPPALPAACLCADSLRHVLNTHTVGKQPGHFASSSGAQMPVNISLTSFLGSRGVRLHVKSLSCNHHVGRLGCATAAGTLYFAGAGGLSRLRHR